MNSLAFTLENEVMSYDWGHAETIRNFLGSPPDCPVVQAECWMGAHPKAPSKLLMNGRSYRLDELIEADAPRYLGDAAINQGWRTLPFLFKLLAAKKALSIQSHPSLDRAIDGFARESEAGLSISAPSRNYKDPNHKPEIIVALTGFLGLCGFRDSAKIYHDFDRISVSASAAGDIVAARYFALFGDLARQRNLTELTRSILELGDDQQRVVECLCRIARNEKEEHFRILSNAAEHYPGDSGLLFFLVLELLKLNPGESFYAPAGVLHAYIEGFGLELMANSDNVLRGGLTSKHIDVPELMASLDFDAVAGVLSPSVIDNVRTFSAPVSEFRLDLIKSYARITGSLKAEIWMCIDGEGELALFDGKNTSQKVQVRKGESYYLTPTVLEAVVSGSVEMARAYIP